MEHIQEIKTCDGDDHRKLLQTTTHSIVLVFITVVYKLREHPNVIRYTSCCSAALHGSKSWVALCDPK